MSSFVGDSNSTKLLPVPELAPGSFDAHLRDDLVAIRMGGLAQQIALARTPQGIPKCLRLEIENLHIGSEEEQPYFEAHGQVPLSLGVLPTDALRTIQANGRKILGDRWLFFRELAEDIGDQSYRGLPKLGSGLEEVYKQEAFLRFRKASLIASYLADGAFSGYLRHCFKNAFSDIYWSERKHHDFRARHRPSPTDLNKGAIADTPTLVWHRLETFDIPKVKLPVTDRSEHTSSLVMHDEPSAEDVYGTDPYSSDIGEVVVDKLLGKIRFFLPTVAIGGQRTYRQAEINREVFLATLFPGRIPGLDDDHLQSKGAKLLNIDKADGLTTFDQALVQHIYSDEEIALTRKKIVQKLKDLGAEFDEEMISQKVSETLSVRVRKVRERGREALIDFMIDKGYTSEENAKKRRFTPGDLAWALANI